jgi:hypothetical protein
MELSLRTAGDGDKTICKITPETADSGRQVCNRSLDLALTPEMLRRNFSACGGTKLHPEAVVNQQYA